MLFRPRALSSVSVSSSLGCCFGRGLSQAVCFELPWVLLRPRALSSASVSSSLGCSFGRGLSQGCLFRAPLVAGSAAGSLKRVCFELPWVLLRPRALSRLRVRLFARAGLGRTRNFREGRLFSFIPGTRPLTLADACTLPPLLGGSEGGRPP